MLQRPVHFEQQLEAPLDPQEENRQLDLAHLFGIAKRRILFFFIPFFLVLVIGIAGVWLWPSKYISTGKILVETQQIPVDLVHPIVTSLANERIQVIEQRIMTRDNLLALAKKYHLEAGLRARLSGTEIVDFIRERTHIAPLEMRLPSSQKRAIAFSVGFEYENPQIAMKVANDLLTMILNEDARSRSEFASEATAFLDRDVKRLDAELLLLDKRIAELKHQKMLQSVVTSTDSSENSLDALKMQLVVKRATLSNRHPDVVALKRKIAAIEKATKEEARLSGGESQMAGQNTNAGGVPMPSLAAQAAALETLEAKRAAVKKEFDEASVKFSTAKLGERLEQGQHSERLEVIEQPSLPTKPASPNKEKLSILAIALAFAAGIGSAAGFEMLDHSVRRVSDLCPVFEHRLIVPIPYIVTQREKRRRHLKFGLSLLLVVIALAAGIAVLLYFYPDPDLLYAKVMQKFAK